MQDVDLVLEQNLPENLSDLNDENLYSIVDPKFFLDERLLSIDDDTESYSEVPASTDSVQQGPQNKTATTGNYSRKRARTVDINDNDVDTQTRPKRQRKTADSDPDWSPGEVFSTPSPGIPQVQSPSTPTPSFPCIPITVRKAFISFPRTATTQTFIIVPAPPHLKCNIPPYSPVNGAVAPVQLSSSPSGSLSDTTSQALFPVCSSLHSPEVSPIKDSPASRHLITHEIPQSVENYIRKTKAHISQACDDLGDGLTLSSHYVNTKVIQRDILCSKKNRNKSLDKELGVMGETERMKSMVDLNRIFEQHHGSRSKSYNLLLGKAGMGKTTCIKKLCLDWSKDCIPQFDFVFLLDGKLLTISEPTHNLETLLLNHSSFAPSCSDSEAAFAQILATSKRVLIIFDGFDDLREFELLLQPLEKDMAASMQKDSKAKTFTIRQLYCAILQRVLLPGCSLLLSSRPRGSASQLLRKVDNLLEVSGFSSQDVETYMKQFFWDLDVRETSINCLQNLSYLKLLCWNPGLCRLVCTILEQNLETLPRTLTGLCHQVFRMKMDVELKKSTQEETQLSEKVQGSKADETKRGHLNSRKSKVCSRQRACKGQIESTKSRLVSELSCLAWETVKANSSTVPKECTISSQTRAISLKTGLLYCTATNRQCFSNAGNKDTEDKQTNGGTTLNNMDMDFGEDCILSWANPFLQSYLAAVHMSLSSSTFVKTLSFQTGSKVRRRPQKEEFELTQRFAVGLLFHDHTELQWLHPFKYKDLVVKQNAFIDHLKCLPFDNINPSQILDICHFVFEGSFTHYGSTKNSSCSQFAVHLVNNLPEKITFNGVPLSPADVFTLKHILELKGSKERSFSLDIQDSGTLVSGLRSLVGLDNISFFRACIADVITLWEELECEKEESLSEAVSKFKINPFKATQVCHIEHLSKLVNIHTSVRLSDSQSSSIFADGVPAVTDLHELELELGPVNGPLALPKLWEVLPGLSNLQHLDLENNKIGDDGAESLAETLVSLSSLETLNLSQNCIGSRGAKKVAAALRHLPKLDGLSLHGNDISDEGANSLAEVLPHMAALTELDIRYNKLTDVGAQSLGTSLKDCQHIKSLRMWSHCIPYGVFERLQQQDHRIIV